MEKKNQSSVQTQKGTETTISIAFATAIITATTNNAITLTIFIEIWPI